MNSAHNRFFENERIYSYLKYYFIKNRLFPISIIYSAQNNNYVFMGKKINKFGKNGFSCVHKNLFVWSFEHLTFCNWTIVDNYK